MLDSDAAGQCDPIHIVLEQREAPGDAQLAGGTVKRAREVNAHPFSANAQGRATLA